MATYNKHYSDQGLSSDETKNLDKRRYPTKMILFFVDKQTKINARKAIDDALKAKKWAQSTTTIEKKTKKTGKGLASILNQKRDKNDAIARSISSTNEQNIGSKAQELIEIADMIKNKLAVYKEEVKDYHENAEIMEMIFSLGMNNESDGEVYLSSTEQEVGKKKFNEQLEKEFVKFLDSQSDLYDGWMPMDEAFCRFNRARGTGIIPPSTFVQVAKERL